MGGTILDWFRVQPEVAKFTRVCSYDRAVYGWSDPSPAPRTSLQIAKELKALLQSATIPGPYVLVGHSFGGYNVRVFASQYPKDVAGMVLVDSSHDQEEEKTASVVPVAIRQREKQQEDRQRRLDFVLAPLRKYLGYDRFTHHNSNEMFYLEQQSKYDDAVEAENKLWDQSGAQARAAGSLGDIPLVVLTAGIPYEPDPLLTAEQMKKQGDIWINVLQREYLSLSTRSRQIVVKDSGHDIPTARPDAIVSAIHEVWSNEIRK